MKIKSGFILRNIADQYVVMPVGDNISNFNGTIVLNSISAFVWEKLQNNISRDELLLEILNEFEVESEVAEKDLDCLIAKFKNFDVIEEN